MRPAFCHSVCGGSGRSPLFLQFLPHQIRQGEAVYIFVHSRIQARPEVQGRQTPHRSQAFSSVSRQATGARFPSVSRRILPRVYSSGAFVRRISPRTTPAAEESRLSQQTRDLLQILHGNALPGGHHPSRRRTPPRRGPPHRSSGAGRTAPWSKSSRNRLLFCPIYFATGASGMQETAWIFPAPPAPEIDNRPLFPYNKNNF